MKQVSKGDIFSVTLEIDDELLAKMKAAPELTNKALQSAADYWHSKILPKHFMPFAAARYDYAWRSKNYRKQQHGMLALVHSGSMKHDLTSKAAFIAGNKTSITLKMWARVLNFVPTMPENSDEKYVQHGGKHKKTGRGYPNMKREIKAITDDEHAAIAAVAKRSLEIAFGDTEGRESDD